MIVNPSITPPSTLQDLIGADLAAQLDRLDLLSRKVFAGKLQGERRSRRRGRSVEFDDYREYAAGDDLRFIDWNVLARLDRFFVKVFQEEEDLALHVVIDTSTSMHAGTPAKLLTAARIATALGYIGLVNNNRVLMTAFGSGRRARLEPLRGRRNVPRITRFIIDSVLAPSAATPGVEPADEFTAAMRGVAADPGGKGVLVVLSDFLIPPGPSTAPGEAGYASGLRLLAGATMGVARGGGPGAVGGGLDLYAVQVLAPTELDPGLETRSGAGGEQGVIVGDLRLQDAETGRFADVTVTPALLKQYRATMKRYVEECGAFCKARGVHHLMTTSDAPVDRFIAGALRRAGALR